MPPEAAATSISLQDKYAKEGRVYITGTQALVRLPLLQRQLDRAQGLNTACYISGYRGSPLERCWWWRRSGTCSKAS